jgi:hypothetical protein
MDSRENRITVSYKVRVSDLAWMYVGSWAVRLMLAPGLFELVVAATPGHPNSLEDAIVGLVALVVGPLVVVLGLPVFNRTLPLIGTTVHLRIDDTGVQGWPAAGGLDQTWRRVRRVRRLRGVITIPFRQRQLDRRGWVPIPERALSPEQASFLADLFELKGLSKSRR